MPITPRLAAALTAAVAIALLAAPTATASPTPSHVTATAAATLPVDNSMRMPRTAHNETVGDFLHKGDQRAVVENGRLNIYSPSGKVAQSVTTDLEPVGPSNSDGRGNTLSVWQGGAMADLADKNNLPSVYLAWTPDALYMAGSDHVGAGAGSDANVYFHNWLYELPPDGSCASRSCAIAVAPLDTIFANNVPFIERTMGVTALTAGQVDGKAFVAIGYSDTETDSGGVEVFDPSNLSVADKTAQYPIGVPSLIFTKFMATAPNQTAVTALAADPSGSGLLAIGTSSPAHTINSIKLEVSTFSGMRFVEIVPDSYRYWNSTAGDDYSPSALSAAVVDRADGSPVAAFGMSDGSVKLWDPTVTTANLLANAPSTGTTTDPNAVDAVGFIDRSDGTSGLPDTVAVSSVGNQARVLRYSGETTLNAEPVRAKGVTTTDVGGIRLWYPGYKTGSLQIRNDAFDPVTISFASRPNAGYGCWFGPAFADRAAWPSASARLASRAVTPTPYTIGGYTAGVDGECAASDFTGQWAAYVVVAPVGRPANTTTAKLVMSRDGKLSVTSVGGSLSVQARLLNSSSTYALGSWELHVAGAAAPQPPPLNMTARQLDPAGTVRPVYRFDVAASSWNLPFSNPRRVSAVMPAYVVQGRADQGVWTNLGRLVPQGQPTRSRSGSVTLAPVSFYWQNPSTGAAMTRFRVTAQGLNSNEIGLRDIPAPVAATHVGQLSVCPVSGGSDCSGTAAPFANGLDQAPLRVQVYGDDNAVLPVSDPNYGRIYYRDDNDDLLTGLIPMDGTSYIRVSPYPGEYSNDGSAGSIVRPSPTAPVGGRYAYLSTSSTLAQEITAYVGGSSEHSQPIEIGARRFTPTVPSGSQAAVGFLVTGCSDYPGTTFCQVASPSTDLTSDPDPNRPALFLTKDPDTGVPMMGLMFFTEAQTALSSLPLRQVAGQPEHNVAETTLSVNNGEVTMNTTSGFQPGDAIDTWLVSHGTNFQAKGVQVGGGN